MLYLQITANTGPAECCLAVAKALQLFNKEATKAGVTARIIEQVDGPHAGSLRSALLELTTDKNEDAVQHLAQAWEGSLLWICNSPYRLGHKRKNWFLGCKVFQPGSTMPESEIRYEATRASGPGGQHVNKTDSAIRATHIATGISVKVQTERSQHANKRLAAQLLSSKLEELHAAKERDSKAERRMQHHDTERGNARRIFVGMAFKEQKA
ncbi:peptide chain release factor H [Undibacterium pigrum]|uniref:Peptide chain release factor n=1 Tax=Undibacterium pigrum TaxID=401470 RepID=A0A318IYS6_9BURK|nr:peptide chain release factor H [Undibacterium pigrum]PXX36828.1 peptide chain release factor [Undibacterium pigrum]